jgi:hypothetical protein
MPSNDQVLKQTRSKTQSKNEPNKLKSANPPIMIAPKQPIQQHCQSMATTKPLTPEYFKKFRDKIQMGFNKMKTESKMESKIAALNLQLKNEKAEKVRFAADNENLRAEIEHLSRKLENLQAQSVSSRCFHSPPRYKTKTTNKKESKLDKKHHRCQAPSTSDSDSSSYQDESTSTNSESRSDIECCRHVRKRRLKSKAKTSKKHVNKYRKHHH